MKKLAAIAVLVAVGLVAPAQAEKPDTADRPAPAQKPAKANEGRAKGRCVARAVGFNASGTLLQATLTAGDPGRYSGTITVHVTRANHGAAMGDQTFTLTNVRVRFRSGIDAAAPPVGSRVKIGGKITRIARKCPADGFEPMVTVKRVDISAAMAAGAEEAKKADGDEAETASAEEAKKADA